MSVDQQGSQEAENPGDYEGQATLFGAMRAGIAGRLESPVVRADEAQIARRFGGRKPGATNVASRQRKALFSQIAGDPFLQSARLLAMPLAQLAAELRCSLIAAAEFQQRERLAVQPYFMSKAPVDVNLNEKHVGLHLHFPVPQGSPAALPGGGAMGAVGLLQAHAASLGVAAAAYSESDEET